MRAGGRVLDPQRRRVTVAADEIPLTPLEFEILLTLVRDPGVVFTRETLMDRVWGYRDYAGGRVVAEHGREPPADPQASGAGRPVPDRHRPDHRVVRGGGAALGRGPDAVRVGRQASGPTPAEPRAASPPRRFRGLLPSSGPQKYQIMATGKPSDPLGYDTKCRSRAIALPQLLGREEGDGSLIGAACPDLLVTHECTSDRA